MAVAVFGKVAQESSQAVATRDHRYARDMRMNGFNKTIGVGGVGQIKHQTSRLLAGFALGPFELQAQPFGCVHGVSTR